MKNILVTGGTGFIGINLVKKLFETNSKIKIYVLSRKKKLIIETGDYKNLSKINFLKGDIATFRSKIKFDEIYHCAFDTSTDEDFLPYSSKTILDGVINISKICQYSNSKKLIFLSSGAVYGNYIKTKDFNKDVVSLPMFERNHHYGLMKAAAEQYLWSLFGKSNTSVSIYRIFSVIGPYMRLNGNFVLGNIIEKILSNKKIKLNSDCNVFRNIIFIDDLIEKIVHPEKTNRFNVQDVIGQNKNLRSLISFLENKYNLHLTFGNMKNDVRLNYIPKIMKKYPNNYIIKNFDFTLNWFKSAKYKSIQI